MSTRVFTTDLRHYLLESQRLLFDVLERGDEDTVAKLHETWTHTCSLYDDCSSRGTIDDDLNHLAYTISQSMCTIITSYLDLEETYTEITERLVRDTESILAEEYPETEDRTFSLQAPSYIPLACDWLLRNLHNPYPSSSQKDTIANASGTPRQNIDSWFVDARRRIGWNTLRKSRFHNKRKEIVEAATRAFISNADYSLVDPKLLAAFEKIRSKAMELYSGRFKETILAATLDHPTPDRDTLKSNSSACSTPPLLTPPNLQTASLPNCHYSPLSPLPKNTPAIAAPGSDGEGSVNRPFEYNDPGQSTILPSRPSPLRRKRCLSDADQRRPKRPRDQYDNSNSPLHASIDIETLESWFSNEFETIWSSNGSVPLDVSLFDSQSLDPSTALIELPFSSSQDLFDPPEVSNPLEIRGSSTIHAFNELNGGDEQGIYSHQFASLHVR
uniref:A2HD1 n=1 Tax=Volvariella volvacea TaxID=36659 RepID=W0C1G1_9AGAR|nr:A2HD1 [Volvariella volvacea]AOC97532.1 HD1 protein [Volvariella volvacea]